MNNAIHRRIHNLLPEITAWRRELHSQPELQFDLPNTARFVADRLREFGVDEVVEGMATSGVVGVIHGRGEGAGRTIGLRSDMDALPIVEATGAAHASQTTGHMHACGHDGHMAMLLGAARALCDSRRFSGKVVVIFQPAEEGGGGGQVMVKEGLMERFGIEEVYGLHNFPGIPVGHFALREGPIMASVDQFDIDVTGVGGHAAMPHTCIDAPLVAAQIIVALQSIAARRIDPMAAVVVSVTAIESEGDAYNVLPQVVRLKGTVRSLDDAIREQTRALVISTAERTAQAFDARASVRYQFGYPATVNHTENTRFCAEVARSVVGAGQVEDDTSAVMGAEDFSYMLQSRPGAFIFMGNGDTAGLHHPKYDFNDDAIAYGCSYWISLVEQALPATA